MKKRSSLIHSLSESLFQKRVATKKVKLKGLKVGGERIYTLISGKSHEEKRSGK